MHAHEHVVLARPPSPLHEGDVLLAVEQRLVGVAGEVAPLGGDAGLGDAADELLVLAAVADEVGDRDHAAGRARRRSARARARGPCRSSCRRRSRTAARPGRARPCGTRSMVASVWPARLSTPPSRAIEREDVAGAGQVAGPGGRVDERLDRWRSGRRPRCRWWCRGGSRRVTRNAVRWLSVFCATISGEVELAGPLGGDRRADVARGVVEEERDRLGRGELGRHDEVALVLAVLVVDDDDDLAPADGGDGVFDLGERHVRHPSRRAGARRTWR